MVKTNDLKEQLNNLNSLIKQNQFEAAIEVGKTLLKANPENIDVLTKLSNAYYQNNDIDKTLETLEHLVSISPSLKQYNNLAKLYSRKGNSNKAIINYLKAIDLKPDDIQTHINIGNFYIKQKNYSKAVEYFSRLIDLYPNLKDGYYLLGNTLREMKEKEKALECYNKTAELAPTFAPVFNNIGAHYFAERNYDKAIPNFKKAYELNPKDYLTLHNLGNAYIKNNDIQNAYKAFQEVIKLNPKYAMGYNSIGNCYLRSYNLQKAYEYYNKTLEIEPEHNYARLNLGMILLMHKDFKKGWPLYEWRTKTNRNRHAEVMPPEEFRWKGQPLTNKTLYVYYEQGFGDTVNFIRFLPELEKLGARVIFKSQTPLVDLLQANYNFEIVDNAVPDEEIQYDYHVSLLSLPGLLNVTDKTIPCKDKYLSANPEKGQYYKETYFNTDKLKVGLFWQGSKTFGGDHDRSIPLQKFLKLAELEGLAFYSFQKGYGEEQLDTIPQDVTITNLGNTFDSFADTAAALQNIDILVTADSAVGHIAGALGKKVLLLLCYIPDWRWFNETEQAPWYNNTRIVKQTKPQEWDDVFERVQDYFKSHLLNKSAKDT